MNFIKVHQFDADRFRTEFNPRVVEFLMYYFTNTHVKYTLSQVRQAATAITQALSPSFINHSNLSVVTLSVSDLKYIVVMHGSYPASGIKIDPAHNDLSAGRFTFDVLTAKELKEFTGTAMFLATVEEDRTKTEGFTR